MHNRSPDVLHQSVHGDGPHILPQHGPGAGASLLHWPSNPDPAKMWYSESRETFGLEDTSDNGHEASKSIGENENDEVDLSEFVIWKEDAEEEEGRVDYNTMLELGSRAPILMDPQSSQGDAQSTSHAAPEPSNTCGESGRAMGRFAKPFEHVVAQSTPKSPTDPTILADDSDFPPPSIFVSNSPVDPIADENSCDLSESYNSVRSPTKQIDMKCNDAQHFYKPQAAIRQNLNPQNSSGYSPTNYEIATHDRQPPEIPGGIDPQSEKIAADSANAFYVDADSTAVDVAATHHTDANFLDVKQRQSSGYLPLLQAPTNHLLSLRRSQNPSWTFPSSSIFQNSSQITTYPTPTLSSRDLPQHQHPDSAYNANDSISTQTIPPRVSPIEPPSPISLSPSSLPDAVDGITRCPHCPDKVFEGTPEAQRNSLQRHKRDCHDGLQRLECLVRGCAVTFAPGRKDNRVKHVRAKHPEFGLLSPSAKKKRKADSDLESW